MSSTEPAKVQTRASWPKRSGKRRIMINSKESNSNQIKGYTLGASVVIVMNLKRYEGSKMSSSDLCGESNELTDFLFSTSNGLVL